MRALTTFVLVLLLSGLAAGQVSRYDNIAMGTLPGGPVLQALPNATITVQACSSNSTSCALPANLCINITDTVCGGSGYLTADSGGNYHFYAKAGRYQITVAASGFQPRVIPDVILPISASDGGGVGTTVTVNGATPVPNSLNFNSTSPLPPTGSTIVQWLLSGNNVLGYITGGTGGGTPFTVNGVTPTGIVNFNASTPLPPPNGINVNWSLVGTSLTAAIVGDGNPNSCFLGTGVFATCPGGGGGGTVTGPTANGGLVQTGSTLGLLTSCSSSQVLAWNGTAWACSANGAAAPANQSVTFTNAVSATLTSTTTSLVWSCYDNSSPANAIYPSNVSVNPSFLVTFNFAVPQSGTCVVNSSGGGGGGGGGGGTITGVTPSQGLAVTGTTIGLQSCSANQILQSAGTTWGCIATPTGGGGGSGTVSSGTAGHFAWYSATGTTVVSNANLDDDATTPSTITSQEAIAAPQINVNGAVGTGISMTGAGGTLPTPAAGTGGIGIGPGSVPQFYSNGGAWLGIPTIYTCTISADVAFSTTQGIICSQALGATARQWRFHCSVPWNFTGGSGTSNVVVGINLSATPSYQTYITPVMWATTGASNMGAVAVNAAGNTVLVNATGLTAGAGGTIFTVNIDGTVAAAANTTIYIYGTASGTGTAAFRPGTTCELI